MNAQVVFDTANSGWAARRSGLCVSLFLHSVEQDVRQRTGCSAPCWNGAWPPIT